MPELLLDSEDSNTKEVGNAPLQTDSKPKYPYGLSITLDSDTVKKLGLEDCTVGTEYDIEGKMKCTNMSENENEDGSYNQTMTMQITSLDCEDCGNPENMVGEADVMNMMIEKMSGVQKGG